jgi:transcriptional regulator with XRE-family HTH domain
MSAQFSYTIKDRYIPVWTLADRLKKARSDLNMTAQQFAEHTGLSVRQIGYAEAGTHKTSDVLITVVSAKTGVDFYWLKTGEVPGLDSADH